ncbi:flagellar basal body rod protein [Virgibacillus sp. 179-BFC.A HS]|uniref:Flagellar basal body rod protein n=1 Tax=Tigheibacillus jepli TaxID=3035914 RepID=A0ABU5CH91_9BACI|nr:flagellar basal body rod protein [Virgibacillus sp. 179-BFC.A HS]MDY0405192.1 flagellar basal body rod protein [Virgibacillus sp. 179-BFC.A HS]
MKKFLLFLAALTAAIVLLVNIGPMILLAVGLGLLYLVFKQFVKSNSTAGKVGWFIAGLIVLSIALANVYAVIGFAAAYVLYVLVKKWKKTDNIIDADPDRSDPFDNFEQQWSQMNHY